MDFRRCECEILDRLGAKPKATLSSYELQIVPGPLPDKARMYPGAFMIQVDRAQWASWSPLQRVAVLAHEMAHDEDPNACEACIDARAGARMRWQGIGLQGAMDALQAIVSTRRVRDSVRAGWEAAESVQSRKGLRQMSDFEVQQPTHSVDLDLTDDPTIVTGNVHTGGALVAIVLTIAATVYVASRF